MHKYMETMLRGTSVILLYICWLLKTLMVQLFHCV